MANQPLHAVAQVARKACRKARRKITQAQTFRTLDQVSARQPCKTAGRVRVLGWDLEYVDARSLREMIELQIFMGYNDFVSANPAPVIFDCGANIGISVLRYRQLFPRAQITAFEADPQIAAVLRRNLARNAAADVRVVVGAVWTEETELPFSGKDAESGHLMVEGLTSARKTGAAPLPRMVKTIRWADYLDQPVDFVKMDIEGAEFAVLASCAGRLANIDKMIIEVHYNVDRADQLACLLHVLHEAGFWVGVNLPFGRVDLRQPFKRDARTSDDQYPVLCAWRQTGFN